MLDLVKKSAGPASPDVVLILRNISVFKHVHGQDSRACPMSEWHNCFAKTALDTSGPKYPIWTSGLSIGGFRYFGHSEFATRASPIETTGICQLLIYAVTEALHYDAASRKVIGARQTVLANGAASRRRAG